MYVSELPDYKHTN